MKKLRYFFLLWFAVLIALGLFSNIEDLGATIAPTGNTDGIVNGLFASPAPMELYAGNQDLPLLAKSKEAAKHKLLPCRKTCKKAGKTIQCSQKWSGNSKTTKAPSCTKRKRNLKKENQVRLQIIDSSRAILVIVQEFFTLRNS